MAAGHGGQVLVAESTAGLLSGVELLDLGPRRLRDLATPVGVLQVRAPSLRTDFPPLRTLDPMPAATTVGDVSEATPGSSQNPDIPGAASRGRPGAA